MYSAGQDIKDSFNSSSDVTVCLTSCGRIDLLRITVDSFFKFNTYSIKEFYIFEDDPNCFDQVKAEFSQKGIIVFGGVKLGQICAIDVMYSHVTTPYIFHMEDDWEFYRKDFIQHSKDILETDPFCFQVWIRAENDTNGHPFHQAVKKTKSGVEFSMLKKMYNNIWHGFSFNPGLRRLEDYPKNGYCSVTMFSATDRAKGERELNQYYDTLGFHSNLIRGKGYVKHIGWDRHVNHK